MECRWVEKPLGELISYMGRGIAPKYTEKQDESSVLVLGQRCVRNQKIVLSQARFHDVQAKPVKAAKAIAPYDILINATGVGSAGRVAQVVDSLPNGATTDSHVLTLRAKEIDPLYLGYFVKAKQGAIERMAEGSTGQTEMNKERLSSEIIVTYPEDVGLQRGIASILLTLDREIALNSRINDHLLEIALAEYRELSQQSRCICALQDCTSLLCRGGAPKYSEMGKFRALNQRCIRNHKIVSEKARTIEEPRSGEKLLRRGDVLICSTGTGTLGRVAQVLFKEEQVTVDSHVTIVRPAHEALVEYLGCWALSSESQFESMAKGSTGQTELPRIELAELEVRLPDSTHLRDFSEGTKPLFEAIQNNIQENQSLEHLRSILLPKLMSGEIDVSRIDLKRLNGHLPVLLFAFRIRASAFSEASFGTAHRENRCAESRRHRHLRTR